MNKLFYFYYFLFALIIPIHSLFVEPLYADWAHTHIVWYNNTQNQSTILKMAQNYMKNQIPFGGFNIDSGWSTCYNDFSWNEQLFPNPKELIDYFHSNNVKVMLWVTSVINTNCKNYQEAKSKGYLLNDGKPIKWWHGHGAFLDFFNPQAKKWWQSQMDRLLDIGIDAWKCDGTDLMTILLRPWPYSSYKKKYINIWDYSDQYYGTFYNYTKQRNQNALIMARPVDDQQVNNLKIYLHYAPKYVMFSGWVGDKDSTSQGLAQALEDVMRSAWRGYLNFGFDIGGYRGLKNKISKNLFLRWVQVGSMVPFMQNGGNGLHEPWAFDQQTVDIYRKYVLIHHELKSFYLTAGMEAYSKNKSVIEPLAKKQQHTLAFNGLQTYGYKLWQTFLVFPIIEENNIADMKVPQGTWIYYFNHSYILDKRVQSRAFKLEQFPIFIKKGSIYPIERQYLMLPYMQNYRKKNINKNIDEIVIVYIDEGIHKKTFIHREYTDYLQLNFNNGEIELQVKRFYESKRETDKQTNITIRIIGSQKTQKIKIIKRQQNAKQNLKTDQMQEGQEELIKYQYEEDQMEDLMFDIQMNNSYKLSGLKFKQVEISTQF